MLDNNSSNSNKEIEDLIYTVRNILDLAKGSVEVAYFLNMPKSVDIFRFVENDCFFRTVNLSSLRTATIEIYKFISESPNDAFRFHRFLNLVGKEIDGKLKSKWKSKFNAIREQRKNIKNLRHWRYAHFDNNGIDLKNNLDQLKEVIDVCREIYSEIILELNFDIYLQLDDKYIESYNGRAFLRQWCNLE